MLTSYRSKGRDPMIAQRLNPIVQTSGSRFESETHSFLWEDIHGNGPSSIFPVLDQTKQLTDTVLDLAANFESRNRLFALRRMYY